MLKHKGVAHYAVPWDMNAWYYRSRCGLTVFAAAVHLHGGARIAADSVPRCLRCAKRSRRP